MKKSDIKEDITQFIPEPKTLESFKKLVDVKLVTFPEIKKGFYKEYYKKMQDGDELYEYSTSKITWENLCGRQGIIIVRDGFIIEDQVLRMN